MARSRRRIESEEEESEEEEEESEEEVPSSIPLESARAVTKWRECTNCRTLTLKDTCGEPCPAPPLSAKIIESRIDSHVRLFEAVCLRGGFFHLNSEDWQQVEQEARLNPKSAKTFYEQNLLDLERSQTIAVIKSALKASQKSANKKPQEEMMLMPTGTNASLASAKKNRCGVCEGCVRDDCGLCRFCRDKPKFGGRNSLKQACEKKNCTGIPVPAETIPVIPAPIDNFTPWQRSLLSNSLWGCRPKLLLTSTAICSVCTSDIKSLTAKSICKVCESVYACNSCISGNPATWYCGHCQQEDAPCWNNMGICTACGQNFTQTRLSQACVECGTTFCMSCAGTELSGDPDQTGSGTFCFYCRVWSNHQPSLGVPLEVGRTKRIQLIGTGI